MTTIAPVEALDALRDALRAMPPDQVRTPSMPVSAFLGEAHRIAEFIRANGLGERLAAVGCGADVLEDFARAAGALTRAEADWQVVRGGRVPRELVALEDELVGLRSRIVAAIRFNLPDDERANAVADAVMEGSGLSDLAMDLNVLAGLLRSRPDGFNGDDTFDADDMAGRAETRAAELSGRYAEYMADGADRAVIDLRNRAWTYADDLFRRIRRAGAYALYDDPQAASAFRNRWNATRQRRAARKNVVAAE